MDEKIVLNPEQVVGRKGGWISFIDSSGVQRKTRASKVKIVDPATPGTPAPAEAASTEPPSDNPVEGQQEAEAPKPVKEPKVAKKSAKTASRSIGDAEFKLSRYEQVKTPSGHVSYDNADKVAQELRGLPLDEVYSVVAKKLDVTAKSLKEKYAKLNAGMQRMNLGNMYRKALGLTGGKKKATKKAA